MCLIVSNKVEFMAHCELTQEVGHEHHCIDIGVNHAVNRRGTKYSTVKCTVNIYAGVGSIPVCSYIVVLI